MTPYSCDACCMTMLYRPVGQKELDLVEGSGSISGSHQLASRIDVTNHGLGAGDGGRVRPGLFFAERCTSRRAGIWDDRVR